VSAVARGLEVLSSSVPCVSTPAFMPCLLVWPHHTAHSVRRLCAHCIAMWCFCRYVVFLSPINSLMLVSVKVPDVAVWLMLPTTWHAGYALYLQKHFSRLLERCSSCDGTRWHVHEMSRTDAHALSWLCSTPSGYDSTHGGPSLLFLTHWFIFAA